MDQAKQGRVESATIEGRTIKWVGTDKKTNVTYSPGDIWMVGDLVKDGVKVQAKPEEEQSFLAQVFISWFPMLLLIGVWIFFMRQMQGGGRGGAFSFGKSKARMLDESNNTVTFADVAGCDEAKEEVSELVEFRRHRHRRHQSSRRAGSRADAARPIRSAGGRAASRHSRPRADPSRTHAQGASGGRRSRRDHRARHAGLLGRRSRQPRQ